MFIVKQVFKTDSQNPIKSKYEIAELLTGCNTSLSKLVIRKLDDAKVTAIFKGFQKLCHGTADSRSNVLPK